MKRIALYCRVSSDDQRKRETIDNQVDILHAYSEMKEDWIICNEYLDDGISGTIAFEERPAGKRLIEDAKKGLFDAILVYRIDRFGRDTLSGLRASESLRKFEVEIISYTEPFDLNTPTGRYQFINYLNMAELERNNILDRMFLGATRAAKQGKWLGGIVPYGYYVNNDGYLEVNEDEAVIVRKMFDMYVNEGMNTVDIAVYLNTVGVPCFNNSRKSGKRNTGVASLWSTGSIQRMLSNSTYMGIHEYGKRSNKRKETIKREVPPIVPIEVWEKAVQSRKENMKMANRNSPNRTFLLRTLIKCGECDRTYYGVFYRKSPSVYSCSSKQSSIKKIYNTNCHNINLVADDIEEYIWDICREILLNYDDYTIELDDEKELKNLNEDLNNFKIKLVELEGEKSNILKLFRRNIIDEKELEQQLSDIRKDITSYESIMTEINSKIDIIKNKESVINKNKSQLELYRDRVESLSDDDKIKIIRLLIKSIVVSTKVVDGYKIPDIQVILNSSELLLEPSRIHSSNEHKFCRILYTAINPRQLNLFIFHRLP
ncbi:recombinase family protein [Clostridium culturomicium]|uniref:recombinase family protein n=1 Tax=Clostridium culturomicium TaxID=1499683 RepID=UPI000694B40E|nr:recombinase family protein [Clostridium culturomicium]